MHALKLQRTSRLSILAAASVATSVALAATFAVGCFAPRRAPDVAVYASGTDLESGNPLVTIHPLSRQIQRFALFVTLARYDTALAPAPYFARAWTWSPDRRTLTFHLVPDLRWHDGAPTTARDVAFTLDAARDPRTGYWRAGDFAAVERVDAIDDTTASIVFHTPQAEFPSILCELPIAARPSAWRHATRRLRARAVQSRVPWGTGRSSSSSGAPAQRWVFRRNDSFPASLGGPPRLRGLVVAVVDEPTTKFAGLASGELDVAGISPSMASLAERDPSLRVVTYPILFTTGLVFNVHRPPFDDPRVRRALSLSIDRSRIVAAALAGFGRPAAGPVPPESPFALDATTAPDTARADSLLDAAGWRRGQDRLRRRDGKAFTADLLTVGSGDNALEQLVQADFAARGIRVNIRQVEFGTFLTEARAATKRFDLLIAGVPGDVSLSFLGAMFDSRQQGGALDYAGFHTSALDSLFTAVRAAPSRDAQIAAWRAVQQYLADQMPVAWIYHTRGVQGLSARLQNVVMDLRGEMVTLVQWQIGEASPHAVAAR